MQRITFALLFLSILFIPYTTNAAPTLKDARGTFVEAGAEAFGGQPPSLANTLAAFIRGALSLLGLIFVSLIVYAGFLWMTAGGDDKRVGKAKDIIKQAIIGIVITMAAYAITNFVVSKLGTALK